MNLAEFNPDQIEEMCKRMTDKDLYAFVRTTKSFRDICAGELNWRRFQKFTKLLRTGLPIGQLGMIQNHAVIGGNIPIDIITSEERKLKIGTSFPTRMSKVGGILKRLNHAFKRFFPGELPRVVSVVSKNVAKIDTIFIDSGGADIECRCDEYLFRDIGVSETELSSSADTVHVPFTNFHYGVEMTIWMRRDPKIPDGRYRYRYLYIEVLYN